MSLTQASSVQTVNTHLHPILGCKYYIFLDLSDEKLLARCVQGATQNPNESINSLVWARCPKHKFNGAGPVKFAAASAVLAFNGGAERQVQLQSSLGTPISGSLVKTFLKRDKRRVKKSQKAADTKQKKKRAVMMKQLRVKREEALREKEGTTYEAGAF